MAAEIKIMSSSELDFTPRFAPNKANIRYWFYKNDVKESYKEFSTDSINWIVHQPGHAKIGNLNTELFVLEFKSYGSSIELLDLPKFFGFQKIYFPHDWTASAQPIVVGYAANDPICSAWEIVPANLAWDEKDTEDNLKYWKENLVRRMPEFDELCRLERTLMGFHPQTESCRKKYLLRLISEIDDSRPFGTKCVEESVAFQLGWDWQRRLCSVHLIAPDFVKIEARRMLSLLKQNFQEEFVRAEISSLLESPVISGQISFPFSLSERSVIRLTKLYSYRGDFSFQFLESTLSFSRNNFPVKK